jgi:hypothetical protein
MPSAILPRQVSVHVNPPSEGTAIGLRFKMSRKNDFGYVAFVDANGQATISADELLQQFYVDWELAIMDYIDPRTGFTGEISVRVLSTVELTGANKAYELFHKYVQYPVDYKRNLDSALKRRQNPADFSVTVDVQH